MARWITRLRWLLGGQRSAPGFDLRGVSVISLPPNLPNASPSFRTLTWFADGSGHITTGGTLWPI